MNFHAHNWIPDTKNITILYYILKNQSSADRNKIQHNSLKKAKRLNEIRQKVLNNELNSVCFLFFYVLFFFFAILCWVLLEKLSGTY